MDVIAEWGGSIKALEIKSSSTFAPDFIKNVYYFSERCRESFPHEKVMTYVVYGGQQGGSFSETTLVPFHDLERELLGE